MEEEQKAEKTMIGSFCTIMIGADKLLLLSDYHEAAKEDFDEPYNF